MMILTKMTADRRLSTGCHMMDISILYHGNQFLNDGVNSTPQATAVKLAQLGEGDARGGKLPPLQSKRVGIGQWMRNKIPLSAI